MDKRLLLKSTLLAIAILFLPYTSFSQDKVQLAKADSLHQLGRDLFHIPEGIKALPESAFAGCGHLKIVMLPSTLIEVGPFAFSQCVSLETISFPEELASVADGAFEGCTRLKSVLMNK